MESLSFFFPPVLLGRVPVNHKTAWTGPVPHQGAGHYRNPTGPSCRPHAVPLDTLTRLTPPRPRSRPLWLAHKDTDDGGTQPLLRLFLAGPLDIQKMLSPARGRVAAATYRRPRRKAGDGLLKQPCTVLAAEAPHGAGRQTGPPDAWTGPRLDSSPGAGLRVCWSSSPRRTGPAVRARLQRADWSSAAGQPCGRVAGSLHSLSRAPSFPQPPRG